MRMPDRCGPATRSLQSEALRAHPPQALGGGLRGQRLAKLDARAEGGAVVDSREAPPTWADGAVGDHDDRGDSTNHRKLAEHNLSLPLASYARRYTRRTCRSPALFLRTTVSLRRLPSGLLPILGPGCWAFSSSSGQRGPYATDRSISS